jgi:hypothetical protein
MKTSKKIAKINLKTIQINNKLAQISPKPSVENKAQRVNGIVGIWADRAEMINPASFVKKQRISRF